MKTHEKKHTPNSTGNFFVSSSQSIISGALNDTLNIGNVSLCGRSNNVLINGFILSDTFYGANVFSMDTSTAQFYNSLDYFIQISIIGTTINNNPIYSNLYIADTVLGLYF